VSGCYDAALRDDAGIDAAFAGDANVDLAACTTATGAVRCDTAECPQSLCSNCFPSIFGMPEHPSPSYCLRGADFAPLGWFAGCSRESFGLCVSGELCVIDRPPRRDLRDIGYCGTAPFCAQLVAESNPYYQCIYEDGTAFRTGEVPRTSCPASVAGRACGPGCARCPEGRVCFGPSEQSGVGVCVPATAWNGPNETPCGEAPHTCEPGQRCLRLVVTEPVSDRLGVCVPAETCADLARVMPQRFACVDE
jgi:hypothetical protein